MRPILGLAAALALALPASANPQLTPAPHAQSLPAPAATHPVRAEIITQGLDHPWGIVFTSDTRALVTERDGRLRVIENGVLAEAPMTGLPEIVARRQGGLLGLALDPDYAANQRLYLAYSAPQPDGPATTIASARDTGAGLADVSVLFTGDALDTGFHYGARIVVPGDGTLVFGIGDRGRVDTAQDLASLSGKMLRINADGSVPAGNPFAGREGVRPEILTYGMRNPQGLAFDPTTGILWESEHGPRGGDEINIIRPGLNYGWKTISWGKPYFGPSDSEAEMREGMEQPVVQFTPSLALAGMSLVTSPLFPNWNGDLIVAALAGGLIRLDVEGERIVAMERLLVDEIGRARDVVQGPDGRLYVLTDESGPDGALIAVAPAQ